MIVAIGDSMAAGEGNPEVNIFPHEVSAKWADTYDNRLPLDTTPEGLQKVAEKINEGVYAHRSSFAYNAQLAMKLEGDDPHTSVTFVSVASSGAKITDGLIESQIDRADHTKTEAKPQLQQVLDAVGNRRIDAMTICIGVNDSGFFDVLSALVVIDPVIPLAHAPGQAEVHNKNGDSTGVKIDTLERVQQFIENGLTPAGDAIAEPGGIGGRGGLQNLPGEYQRLSNALNNQFDIARTFITQYPDPGLDAFGKLVPGLADIMPGLEMDETEGRMAREVFLKPMNQVIKTAGELHGWTVVTGVPESFGVDDEFGHGYTAGPEERWVRTAPECYDVQGNDAFGDENDALAALAASGVAALVVGVEVIAAAAVGGAITASLATFPLGFPLALAEAIGASVAASLGGVEITDFPKLFDDVFTGVRDILGSKDASGTIHPNHEGHNAIKDQHLLVLGNPAYLGNPFSVAISDDKRNIQANPLPPGTEPGDAAHTLELRKRILADATGIPVTFMEVVVNGHLLDAWTDTVNRLEIDAGRADVTVKDILLNLQVRVNGAHSLTAGKGNSLQSLQNRLTIGAAGDPTDLIVMNRDDSAAHTNVQITATQITGLSPSSIVYEADSLSSLTVDTGSGADVVKVPSLPGDIPVIVRTGGGIDVVQVGEVFALGAFPRNTFSPNRIETANILTIEAGTDNDTINIETLKVTPKSPPGTPMAKPGSRSACSPDWAQITSSTSALNSPTSITSKPE